MTFYQFLKTFIYGEISKVLHKSAVEDRHLVAGFENTCVAESRFERVASRNLIRNRQFFKKLPKLFIHVFETPMHLWDQNVQKVQRRNSQNKGSLSENTMKDDERVLFHPPGQQRYCRG